MLKATVSTIYTPALQFLTLAPSTITAEICPNTHKGQNNNRKFPPNLEIKIKAKISEIEKMIQTINETKS
jgi:hypothetical protein